MTSSALPAVSAALVTLFEAAPALAGVDVSHISPDPREPKEWLIVGAAKTTREWKALGNAPTPLDETFTIPCEAACVKAGRPTFTEAQTRAFEILAAAESALRADKHLGTTLVRHYRVASVEEVYSVVDKGRVCTVRFVIEGKTRI